ncbi:MAG: dTDP-4-dehydrorhamnose reductase [Spirochaetia bacterium]|nr:dTDP-4-dehydrorhamnose reductase [Spirochaetia bacterium]MDY3721416.1 dTDP-4-dehydrorhamnose reductase [Treponema sp.]
MIWLIGCKGMLGTEVGKQLDEKKIPWVGTDKEVDITNPQALEDFVNKIETESYFPSDLPRSERKIKWIINCSAYTNVDKAEEDVELAEKLNAAGPLNIARTARAIGAKLIHISTDYVFNGTANSPYTEEMHKEPLGVYGKTKAAGEDAIMKEMNTFYIIRTAWLYGYDGRNFVYTMTKVMNSHDTVRVVNDQFGTPTYAPDLANAILTLIAKNDKAKTFFGKNSAPSYGIYHFTDEGTTNWFEFAQEIYKLGRKYGRITQDCNVTPCTTEEYGAKVQRPAYSVLSKAKISKALKIKIPEWQQSLEKYMKNSRFNPL